MPSNTAINSVAPTSEEQPEVKVTSNDLQNDLEQDLASAVASLSLAEVPKSLAAEAQNDLRKGQRKEEKKDLESSDEDNNREDEEAIVGLGDGNLAGNLNLDEEKKKRKEDDGEEDGEESGTYTSKGPMRQRVSNAVTAPYARPPANYASNHAAANNGQGAHMNLMNDLSSALHMPNVVAAPMNTNNVVSSSTTTTSDDLDLVSMGHFLDEIYPELSLATPNPGIPALPKKNSMTDLRFLGSLDQACGDEAQMWGRLLLRNKSAKDNISVLSVALSVILDEHHLRMGINIPRTQIPTAAVPIDMMNNKMDIYIQLNPKLDSIIKVSANLEEANDPVTESPCWMIKSQFLKLEPFEGDNGIKTLLKGVEPHHLVSAFNYFSGRTDAELSKTFHPNQDTLVTILAGRPDSPQNRAEILVLVKKLLASTDPRMRNLILAKSAHRTSAVEYAIVKNKMEVARFLIEVFYDLGEDLTASDAHKNNYLHMCARKGDASEETLRCLLELKFRGGKRVFTSKTANIQGQLPIHFAARQVKHQPSTMQLLSEDLPGCYSMAANCGSLPLHFACQYSKDPRLVEFILTRNPNAINVRRSDGFTPLHLAAARFTEDDRENGLISLDENSQLAILRTLLDHGADKTIKVEGLLALNVVSPDRHRVRSMLKHGVRGANDTPMRHNSSSGDENSPNSGSPNFQNGFHDRTADPLGLMQHQQMMAGNGMSPSTASMTSGICSDMSPLSTFSQQSPTPMNGAGPNVYNNVQNGGLNNLNGGDNSSGSDSEIENQLGLADQPVNSGNNQLDAIAGVLMEQFPSIQDILNNDPDLN